MTAAAHIAVGAAICSRTRRPWLGLPAAFASHFLLDAWPHFEQFAVVSKALGCSPRQVIIGFYALDWATSTVIIVLLARALKAGAAPRWRWAYIIGGGLLAHSPDWLKAIGGPDAWFATFHSAMHTQAHWHAVLHRYFAQRSVPAPETFADDVLARSAWARTGWAFMIGWEVLLIVVAARIALAALVPQSSEGRSQPPVEDTP